MLEDEGHGRRLAPENVHCVWDNRLWVLKKVFPTCAASEDILVTLLSEEHDLILVTLANPRLVMNL